MTLAKCTLRVEGQYSLVHQKMNWGIEVEEVEGRPCELGHCCWHYSKVVHVVEVHVDGAWGMADEGDMGIPFANNVEVGVAKTVIHHWHYYLG